MADPIHSPSSPLSPPSSSPPETMTVLNSSIRNVFQELKKLQKQLKTQLKEAGSSSALLSANDIKKADDAILKKIANNLFKATEQAMLLERKVDNEIDIIQMQISHLREQKKSLEKQDSMEG